MGEQRMNGARLNPEPGRDCNAMMKRLRTVDFALVEANLYLDAYPDSASALEYYHKLLAERKRLADMINGAGMPLTARDNVSTTEWNWVNGPWPWHPDAN